MKTRTTFISDTFTDFAGLKRIFTICAISEEIDSLGYKGLQLGISVQNPLDSHNAELSKKIAEGKAIKKPFGKLVSDNTGFINSKVVNALLEQECEYFKNNPGKYIAGYNKDLKLYQSNPEKYLEKFKIVK